MSRQKIKDAFELALIEALGTEEVDAATMGVARAYLKDTEDPKAAAAPRPKSANESIIADAFMAHAKGLPFGGTPRQ